MNTGNAATIRRPQKRAVRNKKEKTEMKKNENQRTRNVRLWSNEDLEKELQRIDSLPLKEKRDALYRLQEEIEALDEDRNEVDRAIDLLLDRSRKHKVRFYYRKARCVEAAAYILSLRDLPPESPQRRELRRTLDMIDELTRDLESGFISFPIMECVKAVEKGSRS
jgi:hypothetical protein